MIGVLWAYEGWQYVTFAAGETVDAERNFPRAMLIGTSALIAIYLLPNIAYIAALGPEGVARSERVASEAVTALMGPVAGNLIAAVILVSIFSAANGLTLTAPRVYFAMAKDRVFFSRLAEVHPRFGTPAFAIVVSSAWAVLLAATGTFEQLLTYVVFAGWIFYALGAASIFVFRRAQKTARRPFSVRSTRSLRCSSSWPRPPSCSTPSSRSPGARWSGLRSCAGGSGGHVCGDTPRV